MLGHVVEESILNIPKLDLNLILGLCKASTEACCQHGGCQAGRAGGGRGREGG